MSNLPIPVHELLGREPDQDYDMDYVGYYNRRSGCNVKVWVIGHPHMGATHAFVLFTDQGKGTSVTNAAETVVETFYNTSELSLRIPQGNFVFAETYEEYPKESVDCIIPTWKGRKCVDVKWKHIGIIKRS